MKRIALVVIVALLSIARADETRRFPLEFPSFGFAATFPYEEVTQQTLIGSMIVSAVAPDGTTYGIAAIPIPDEVATKPVRQQLDTFLSAAAVRAGGKLAAQKDVKLGPHFGREAGVRSKGGRAAFRAYLVGKTCYMLVVAPQGRRARADDSRGVLRVVRAARRQ